jgi:hypothetical protein
LGGGSFPYVEFTDLEEDEGWDDEELPVGAHPKLSTLYLVPSDHMDGAKADKFYFVGGNTKLSESPVGNSMVPLPNSTPGKTSTRSPAPTRYWGPSSGFATGYATRPTGTKAGWSAAPEFNGDTGHRVDSLEDILDDDPDQRHLDDLRQYVRLLLTFNDE